MQLPVSFLQQIKSQLGSEEADRFLTSFEGARAYGLRINPLKLNKRNEAFIETARLFNLEPVPWCPTGYYYDSLTRPGKHPFHAAGLYYIQEPSAMSAVELLGPEPDETILDLAAAPGGKTSQIAGRMMGLGLLVANEIHPARAKILSENVERMGIVNAVVTNAAPDELSVRFPDYFDRIMLDAPCSGEGMFRKDPGAIDEWSEAHVDMCSARQADILGHAAVMLKYGGRLVYSTCTFNRKENEDTVETFSREHPEFSVERMERIWPHLARGEGHFVAVLRKGSKPAGSGNLSGSPIESHSKRTARSGKRSRTGEAPLAADMELFRGFATAALPGFSLGAGEPLRFGDALYWLPRDSGGRFSAADLEGLRVARPGLHLGIIRKNRIEPSHALALAVSAGEAAWVQSYSPESPETAAYLRGETLPAEADASGWGLVAVQGHPLGWGKASGGPIKNHLPKGLRWFS